jgi:methionine-rich copper-binding protein CopC
VRLRALAATAALLLVPTTAAYAHTPLKSVTPKKNSTQHKAVKEVRATFKAKMQTGIITITTSSGSTVALKSSGLISSNKAVIRGVPKSALGSGTYKVSWRARAGDGHSEKGSWSFKVKL